MLCRRGVRVVLCSYRTKRNIGYWILSVPETKTKGLELLICT